MIDTFFPIKSISWITKFRSRVIGTEFSIINILLKSALRFECLRVR